MTLYGPQEEVRIIKYIVENDEYFRIKGDALWKKIADEKIVNRTWQSLKQHFRARLIYDLELPRFGLTQQEIKLFKDAFNYINEKHAGAKKKQQKEKEVRKTPEPELWISDDDSDSTLEGLALEDSSDLGSDRD